MGFCISLHLFCLTFLCFCLRLSSNREQPPGSFVRADSAERAYLCCKAHLCTGACNVFSRKQLMQGEESISTLIHVDTVSFFSPINFLTFSLGKLQVKTVFNVP